MRETLLTFNGRTQTHTAWAYELGITPRAFKQRLRHWPLERALTVRRDGPHYRTRRSKMLGAYRLERLKHPGQPGQSLRRDD